MKERKSGGREGETRSEVMKRRERIRKGRMDLKGESGWNKHGGGERQKGRDGWRESG